MADEDWQITALLDPGFAEMVRQVAALQTGQWERDLDALRADNARLRAALADLDHRLMSWTRLNDAERGTAGMTPTFLNPHTVLDWLRAALAPPEPEA